MSYPLVVAGYTLPGIDFNVYLIDEGFVVSKYPEWRGRYRAWGETFNMPKYLHLRELVMYLMPAVFAGYLFHPQVL